MAIVVGGWGWCAEGAARGADARTRGHVAGFAAGAVLAGYERVGDRVVVRVGGIGVEAKLLTLVGGLVADRGEDRSIVYRIDRYGHGLLGAGLGRSAESRAGGTAVVRIAAVGDRVVDIHGAVEVGSRSKDARRARATK